MFILPIVSLAQNENPARQLIVEKIEFEGNTKTRPFVIMRYVPVEVGQPLNPMDLLVAQQQLEETDFFKKVDVYTRPGSEKGLIVVVVEIKERSWPFYRFEGGHSDLEGWYIVPISFRFDNFFGRGNFMGWQWRVGNQSSRSSLTYFNPYLFDSRGYVYLDLFSADQDYDQRLDGKTYEEYVTSTGFLAKIGGREGRYSQLFGGMRWEYYRPCDSAPFETSLCENEDIAMPSSLRRDLDNTMIGALSAGWEADFRDNTRYPTRGFWGTLKGEIAHEILGSDRNFPRLVFDARWYRQMTQQNVVAFRLYGGLTTNAAPFYERFYLGGTNSLRGYTISDLTPPGWGTRFFLSQTEVRIPLTTDDFPNHGHTFVFFYDAGGIWQPDEFPTIFENFSLGVGYRVKIKLVGITRIDLGFPLNDLENRSFRLHLTFGDTF